MRPKALDLFCGAGGASMGLHRAGFDVVGVDIAPQPRYPFAFVLADAMRPPFDLSQFDFIWASPPCQSYSALKTMKNAGEHPALVPAVRSRLDESGVHYAIENVYGAPLLPGKTTMLCGTMFGLQSRCGKGELRRHRYFETSFPIVLRPPCQHSSKITLGIYGGKVRNIAQEKRHYAQAKETRGQPIGVVLPQSMGKDAMGIDWMSMDELSEAIPPIYAEYIARHALNVIVQ